MAVPGVDALIICRQVQDCMSGSPSLVIWTNGDYIASHDFFGPKSTERTQAVTAIFSFA